MIKNKPCKVKSAISLQYQKEINSAPKITARGEGWVAEKIIENRTGKKYSYPER